jgi:hypothetical protein
VRALAKRRTRQRGDAEQRLRRLVNVGAVREKAAGRRGAEDAVVRQARLEIRLEEAGEIEVARGGSG